jgi:hypothetical protein
MEAAKSMVSVTAARIKATRVCNSMPWVATESGEKWTDLIVEALNVLDISNHRRIIKRPATKHPRMDIEITPILTGRWQQKVVPPKNNRL